jgi:hypothetical protein
VSSTVHGLIPQPITPSMMHSTYCTVHALLYAMYTVHIAEGTLRRAHCGEHTVHSIILHPLVFLSSRHLLSHLDVEVSHDALRPHLQVGDGREESGGRAVQAAVARGPAAVVLLAGRVLWWVSVGGVAGTCCVLVYRNSTRTAAACTCLALPPSLSPSLFSLSLSLFLPFFSLYEPWCRSAP